jgi:hypothetical protein
MSDEAANSGFAAFLAESLGFSGHVILFEARPPRFEKKLLDIDVARIARHSLALTIRSATGKAVGFSAVEAAKPLMVVALITHHLSLSRI